MRVKLYAPENPLLKKYIECIYVLTQETGVKPTQYLTFPSVFTIVSSSEMSETIQKGNDLIIRHSKSNAIETNVVFDFNKPVLVEYEGRINEITIYFKPLAINSFLEHELHFYNKSSFADFSPFDDYKKTMAEILSLPNDEAKIQAVESYWLTKLRGFSHHFLEDIVSEMMNKENENVMISELCKRNSISRTTLNKHFDRHICKTPSQFKKILRFRNAVSTHEAFHSKNKLTDMAFSIHYFDQSHMIKEFKSLTGLSPKSFFKNTTEIEKKQIRWQFL